MRTMLGESLKDNVHIHKAILTGILRISKESIFSGLNNVEVYTTLSSEYADCFGFSEAEVIALLKKSKVNYNAEEVRAWYNGYQFGGKTIYNPWSIIKYAKQNGDTGAYWVNTSSNEVIRKLLLDSNDEIKTKIFSLLNDGQISEIIDENLSFQGLEHNQSALWTLFLMSGYLRVVALKRDDLYGPICTMKIPNKEVESIYTKTFREWISGSKGIGWYQQLLENLTNGNTAEFKEQLEYILTNVVSIRDVTQKTQESFYHGVAIGLLSGLKHNYYIQSNRESGKGFYDLVIIPKNDKDISIIMEFKSLVNASGPQLQTAANKALKQINEKQYITEICKKTTGKILKLGIAFSGKQLVLCKEVWFAKVIEQSNS